MTQLPPHDGRATPSGQRYPTGRRGRAETVHMQTVFHGFVELGPEWAHFRGSTAGAPGLAVERQHGLPGSRSGRRGHGLRNAGGRSVHPDSHTVLEPGMVISVEPMLNNAYGYYDLEDPDLVTETGRECLHEPAPETRPVIA